MNETCVSKILYEFNIIWRNIMRKENEAIKKKYTLQIQDLRRQLVTKKAFDEDESQREISRLKKELHFIEMQLKEAKRNKNAGVFAQLQKGGNSGSNMDHVSMSKSTKRVDMDQMENGGMDGMEQSKSMKGAAMMQASFRDEMGMHEAEGESFLMSEVMWLVYQNNFY